MSTDIEPIPVKADRAYLITPDMDVEKVATIIDHIAAMEERLKAAKEIRDAGLMDWIEQNGPLLIGDIKWFVGPKKTTKCRNVPACVEALLVAVGGDFNRLCELLASQPIKYGAAKEPLGEAWGEYFEVVEERDLKTNESTKRVQKVDQRFLKYGEAHEVQ